MRQNDSKAHPRTLPLPRRFVWLSAKESPSHTNRPLAPRDRSAVSFLTSAPLTRHAGDPVSFSANSRPRGGGEKNKQTSGAFYWFLKKTGTNVLRVVIGHNRSDAVRFK